MTPTTGKPTSVFLTPKDLIYVGIFTALYLVVSALTMIGLLNPALFLPALGLVVLANGPTVMVFFHKVPRLGGLVIIGIIMGLFMMLAGHAAVTLPLAVGTALLGEAIRYIGRKPGSWWDIIAYATFSLWIIGPLFPIFYMPTEYFASMNERMADRYPGFGTALEALISPGVLIGFEVVLFILGIIGALIGKALLKRHFSRAGVL